MNRRWVTGIGIVVLFAAAPAGADKPITSAELAERLAGGPQRVELEIAADGRVVRVEIDDDVRGDDELEGRIVSVDVEAATLNVEHIGTLHLGESRRHEIDDRRVERREWLDEVRLALEKEQDVWVEADGVFRAQGFSAMKVELERSGRAKLSASIVARDFDAQAATIHIGSMRFDIAAASIVLDD